MSNSCRMTAALMLVLTLSCTKLLWADLPQKGDVVLGVNGARQIQPPIRWIWSAAPPTAWEFRWPIPGTWIRS